MSNTDMIPDWGPEPVVEWEQPITDHLPTNWAWLDRMFKEAQAARVGRAQPHKYGLLGFVPGAQESNSTTPWGFEWSLVPMPEEEPLSSCLGTPTIIRATYEMEVSLNYFRSQADKAGLLEAKPYLQRLGKIAGILVKDATKIERREYEAGLFD